MDDKTGAFEHFVMDMFVEIVRSGAIPPETMERLRDGYAYRGGEFGDKLASMAAGVALEASMAPTNQREFEATFRRNQIRKRTAMIERHARLTAVTGPTDPE